MLHAELSNKIIKSFYKVYNHLGYGFLEKVYENALCLELQKSGLKFEKQKQIKVFYDGYQIGEYFADILVEGKIIIELKATESISKEHECQLINYLKATKIELGLLFNFGKEPQFRRKIFTNNR
ncbi:MAG: GxxExxY protein [Schleiferiaceae bacterium]|nr:GxxExxY protein [Schleiferiaceae bacterium]